MPGDNPEVYSTQVHNHKVREVRPEVDDTRVHNSIVREVNLEVDGTRVHYKTVRGPAKATEQIRRPKAEPAVVTEQISRLTAEPVVVTEQMKSLTAGLVMVAVAKGVQRTTMWKVAEECGRGKTRRRYKNHNRLSRLLRGSCRLWSWCSCGRVSRWLSWWQSGSCKGHHGRRRWLSCRRHGSRRWRHDRMLYRLGYTSSWCEQVLDWFSWAYSWRSWMDSVDPPADGTWCRVTLKSKSQGKWVSTSVLPVLELTGDEKTQSLIPGSCSDDVPDWAVVRCAGDMDATGAKGDVAANSLSSDHIFIRKEAGNRRSNRGGDEESRVQKRSEAQRQLETGKLHDSRAAGIQPAPWK